MIPLLLEPAVRQAMIEKIVDVMRTMQSKNDNRSPAALRKIACLENFQRKKLRNSKRTSIDVELSQNVNRPKTRLTDSVG